MTNVSKSLGFHERGGTLTASLIELKFTALLVKDAFFGTENNLISVIGLRSTCGGKEEEE
jgi:hypothetical protein